jgi:hypothetical protein
MRKYSVCIIAFMVIAAVFFPCKAGFSWPVDKVESIYTLDQVKAKVQSWLDDPDPYAVDHHDYWVSTHPYLTRKTIDLFEQSYGVTLSSDQKKEILWGSVEEDYDVVGTATPGYAKVPMDGDLLKWPPIWRQYWWSPPNAWPPTFQRAYNHYIGPGSAALTDSELIGHLLCPGQDTVSSLKWAADDNRNYMNWVGIIECGNTPENWRAIGHILHLLQDAAVPSHVRNDAHPFSDYNEPYWHEKTIKAHNDVIGNAPGAAILLDPSAIAPYFTALADYTRSHYFSSDTVFRTEWKGVELPDVDYVDISVEHSPWLFNKDASGNPYKKIAYKQLSFYRRYDYFRRNMGYSHERAFDEAAVWLTVSTPQIAEDIFSDTGLKAIQYGAGLLKVLYDRIVDADNDGYPNAVDNCPNTYNPDQTDSDHNGIGDACEAPSPSQTLPTDSLSCWQQTNGPDGEFSVNNGALRSTLPVNGSHPWGELEYTCPISLSTAYEMSYEARLVVSGHTYSGTGADHMLVSHWVDSNSFAQFGWRQNEAEDFVWSSPGDDLFVSYGFDETQWHTVKLIRNGSHIEGYQQCEDS